MQRLPEATQVTAQCIHTCHASCAIPQPPKTELSIYMQSGPGLADFTLRGKKRPMESRAAQDTRLCGPHNQVAGIARPSRWYTELHEAAEQNSSASLDVHRTSTPSKHRPPSTDRATDSATAATCYRCEGRHHANDW